MEEISEINEIRVFDPAPATEFGLPEFIVVLFMELKREKAELNHQMKEQDKEVAFLCSKVNSLEKDNNSAFEFKDKEMDKPKQKLNS